MTTPESSHPQPTEAMSSPSEQLVVNLQIVSPSVGVNRPLLFPDLPATMTIKRLKDKIRQTLPLRPSDENQRLIHRGRALVRESDSLLDIFGADVLRVPERQTIHLVIRDAADIQTPTLPTVARGPSPTQSGQTANVPRAAHSPHPQFGPEPPPGFPRRSHYQTTTHIAQPRVPSPAPTPLNVDQAATFQQQHQNMTNWLGQVQRDAQLQREAMVRALVNQNQRGRAQMGMRGVGDSSSHGGASGSEANNGRVSPGGSHSVHYEAFGSNGQPYHVDNVNIMRSADANQAAMAMANALQRSASGPSLHSRPLTQPGVTTPILGPAGSLAGSGRATPDQDPRPTASGHVSTTQSNSLGQPQHGPQVYLVSMVTAHRSRTSSRSLGMSPQMSHPRNRPSRRYTQTTPGLRVFLPF
ncbi:hypothetical protein CDD83_9078 [Cordyceps sp. RAO-2017]|nr:hypothetical protein CDD83_9078 [Cordyceps sp. RAO-2017]